MKKGGKDGREDALVYGIRQEGPGDCPERWYCRRRR